MRILTNVLLCTLFLVVPHVHALLNAQVPRLLTVQLYLENSGVPMSGRRTIDVRWYDVVSGGNPLFNESIDVDVELGIASVILGSTKPLPDTLLLKGQIWLGITVDGGIELSPRTILASVPYAIVADRARIAQALAPEVTGVVTSVNEIAGVVRIEGDNGIRVSRNGHVLELSSDRIVERGSVPGSNAEHVFLIRPAATLTPSMYIDVHVKTDGSTIACFVKDVDITTNTITVVTSAPLLSTESLEWMLMQ